MKSERSWRFIRFGTSSADDLNTVGEDADINGRVTLNTCTFDENGDVIRKGGMETLNELQNTAKVQLGATDAKNAIPVLDAICTRYGVSPGGCADLLAVTYFLHLCFGKK